MVIKLFSVLPSIPCCPEQRREQLSCKSLEVLQISYIESATPLKVQIFRLLKTIRKAQSHFLRYMCVMIPFLIKKNATLVAVLVELLQQFFMARDKFMTNLVIKPLSETMFVTNIDSKKNNNLKKLFCGRGLINSFLHLALFLCFCHTIIFASSSNNIGSRILHAINVLHYFSSKMKTVTSVVMNCV